MNFKNWQLRTAIAGTLIVLIGLGQNCSQKSFQNNSNSNSGQSDVVNADDSVDIESKSISTTTSNINSEPDSVAPTKQIMFRYSDGPGPDFNAMKKQSGQVSSLSMTGAGIGFACGISDGMVKTISCWTLNDDGFPNESGEFAKGNTTPIASTSSQQFHITKTLTDDPHVVVEFSRISVGYDHSCAVSIQGKIYCWGSNESGKSGQAINSGVDIRTPAPITQLTMITPSSDSNLSFVNVSAGYQHTCALSKDGNVYCWGDNNSKQLGRNNAELPLGATWVLDKIQLDAKDNKVIFKDISVGYDHSCALSTDNRVFCWGGNKKYQSLNQPQSDKLSDGSIIATPTEAHPGYKFKKIVAGNQFNCGILLDGKLFCFGKYDDGQLGDNLNSTSEGRVQNLKSSTFHDVVLGDKFACALSDDYLTYCWGTIDGLYDKPSKSTVKNSNVALLLVDSKNEPIQFRQLYARGNYIGGIKLNCPAGYHPDGESCISNRMTIDISDKTVSVTLTTTIKFGTGNSNARVRILDSNQNEIFSHSSLSTQSGDGQLQIISQRTNQNITAGAVKDKNDYISTLSISPNTIPGGSFKIDEDYYLEIDPGVIKQKSNDGDISVIRKKIKRVDGKPSFMYHRITYDPDPKNKYFYLILGFDKPLKSHYSQMQLANLDGKAFSNNASYTITTNNYDYKFGGGLRLNNKELLVPLFKDSFSKTYKDSKTGATEDRSQFLVTFNGLNISENSSYFGGCKNCTHEFVFPFNVIVPDIVFTSGSSTTPNSTK